MPTIKPLERPPQKVVSPSEEFSDFGQALLPGVIKIDQIHDLWLLWSNGDDQTSPASIAGWLSFANATWPEAKKAAFDVTLNRGSETTVRMDTDILLDMRHAAESIQRPGLGALPGFIKAILGVPPGWAWRRCARTALGILVCTGVGAGFTTTMITRAGLGDLAAAGSGAVLGMVFLILTNAVGGNVDRVAKKYLDS